MQPDWHAMYKALAAGISDEKYIINAEKLVKIALDFSVTSAEPFETIFYAMLQAAGLLQREEQEKTPWQMGSVFGLARIIKDE